jgi:hypothetical protein
MFLTLPAKFWQSLREQGFRKTIQQTRYYLSHQLEKTRPSFRLKLKQDRAFDTAYGVETQDIVKVKELDFPEDVREYCREYGPTPVWVFQDVLQDLPVSYEDYTLIDYGSGKGRTLLLASEYPFKKVIGLELSSRLTEIARKNIQFYKPASRRCRDVQALCVNAIDFEIPNEKIIFYFYNPFRQPILGAVFAKIELSLKQSPRDVFLVYVNPSEVSNASLAQSEHLRLFNKKKRYRIYTNVSFA